MGSEREETIRRLAAHNAAAQVLIEAESVQAMLDGVVEAVTESLGWAVGVYWALEEAPARLVARSIWRRGDAARLDAFEALTRESTFERGVGLPGRVWAAGEPAWIPDLSADPNYPRAAAAARAGLSSGFAFPVALGGEFLGALECYTEAPRQSDPELLETMAAVGAQIGLFTQRRRAADELAASERRYRLLAETSTDVIITIDASSTILSVNPAVRRVFGYPPEELVGQPLTMLMPPEMRERHLRGFRRYIETGRRNIPWDGVELPGLRRDGTHVPLEISFGSFVQDGVPVFTGIIRDASERMRQQERLEQAAAELEATVDELERQRKAAHVARVDALDAADWSRFLAEAGRRLAGSLDVDRTLRTLAELAVPRLADWCVVDALEETGEVRRVEATSADPARAPLDRELRRRWVPEHGGRGAIARVLATGKAEVQAEVDAAVLQDLAQDDAHLAALRDIGLRSLAIIPLVARERVLGAITAGSTDPERRYGPVERTRLESLAGRAALAVDNARLYEEAVVADRAKANFLAVMSHELRTPLTAIMGYADILTAGISGPVTEKQQGQLRRILLSARHLLHLIDEVLAFARTEAGREQIAPEDVDLGVLLDEIDSLMRPIAEEKRLRFVVHGPQSDGLIRTDPGKVRQILLNLLYNAVKFTREGTVSLEASHAGDDIVFEVRDTGIGIRRNHLARIFEPFWQVEDPGTRHQEGTGLGLSVAARLARLLGGSISVVSEPGAGSTFTVRLPCRVPLGV